MITEKKSLSGSDFGAIFLAALASYLIAGVFLHSGPPEIHDFAYRTCLLLSLIFFLKKIGLSFSAAIGYFKRDVKADIVKGAKYFFLISIGVTLAVAVMGGAAVLFALLFPSVSSAPVGAIFPTVNFYLSPLPPAFNSPARTFFYIATLCFVVPILEEIIFRRFLFVSLRKSYTKPYAIMLSSLIFGAVHFEGFIVAAVMGGFISYIYEKEERLSIPIIIHALKNITAIFIELAFHYFH